MKLSDAIRKGSLESIARQGSYIEYEENECFACVLGAAALGCGVVVRADVPGMGRLPEYLNDLGTLGMFKGLLERYPEIINMIACPVEWCNCPCKSAPSHLDWGYGSKEAPLGVVIEHLFEQHDWSREAIAMWVETVEPKRTEQSSEPTTPLAEATGIPTLELAEAGV